MSLAILHKCVDHLKFYSKQVRIGFSTKCLKQEEIINYVSIIQLSDHGIDVIYLIDGHLRTPLTRIMLETRNKLAESVNTKIAEEKWHLTNLKSKQMAEKLVSEFNNLGISGTEKYIQG